jgi:hypothetical protein
MSRRWHLRVKDARYQPRSAASILYGAIDVTDLHVHPIARQRRLDHHSTVEAGAGS